MPIVVKLYANAIHVRSTSRCLLARSTSAFSKPWKLSRAWSTHLRVKGHPGGLTKDRTRVHRLSRIHSLPQQSRCRRDAVYHFITSFFVFSATVNISVRWCIQRRFNSALFLLWQKQLRTRSWFYSQKCFFFFILDCCGSFTSRAAESRTERLMILVWAITQLHVIWPETVFWEAQSNNLRHPLPASWRHRSLSHRKVIVHGMEPIITSLAYVIAFNAAIYNPPALPSSHSARIARLSLAWC